MMYSLVRTRTFATTVYTVYTYVRSASCGERLRGLGKSESVMCRVNDFFDPHPSVVSVFKSVLLVVVQLCVVSIIRTNKCGGGKREETKELVVNSEMLR